MEVRNLMFAYDTKTRRTDGKLANKILDGVSFQINRGQITTLLGANGCGKTTLFNLMTKNLIPLRGKVLLDGRSIRHMKQRDFARRVAIVHQNNQAAADITVEKLVAYGRTPYQGAFSTGGSEDRDIIQWAMEATGVADLRSREVMRLSGGQRQRVWMAMALAQKTDILFLDEPTTYLDIRYQIELLELIRSLNETYGITIIMVLHDMNHAVYYSDEIIGLKSGSILMQGRPQQVITPDSIEALYGIRLDVTQVNGRRVVMTVR